MAHSSTGGSEVPAYDRCYILTTDIYVIEFRAVCIGIYYAVLIATPEAIQTSVRANLLYWKKYRNQYYDKFRKQFIDIVDHNARRFLIDT